MVYKPCQKWQMTIYQPPLTEVWQSQSTDKQSIYFKLVVKLLGHNRALTGPNMGFKVILKTETQRVNSY